jgi:hypothetical protein
MEREGTGMKCMAATCEGSQSPPRAVDLRKKKERKKEVSSQLSYMLITLNFMSQGT